MSIFEHHRFEIWNQTQHPYRHDLNDFSYTSSQLPGVTTIESALNWVVAVLYPTPKTAVATPAALPLVSNSIGDYRVVNDDGDGKSAGYRWEQREGDASAKWYKIYDMDFGAGSVLSAGLSNLQTLFVQKYGFDDLDSTGVAVTGTLAGQTVFGGKSASTNLTLKANAGDGVGAQTGFIQFGDHVRATADASVDLGTTLIKFRDFFLSRNADIGGTLAVASTSALSNAVTIMNSGAQNLLNIYRDTNAGGSTNSVGLKIGNSGTSQGSASIYYTNAAATAVPRMFIDFSPRDNGNTTTTDCVRFRFSKTNASNGGDIIIQTATAAGTLTTALSISNLQTFEIGPNNGTTPTHTVYGNLYMNSCASVGGLGVSNNILLTVSNVGGSGFTLGTTVQYGIQADVQFNSSSTAEACPIVAKIRTENASYTTAFAAAFSALTPSKGAANTITRLFAYFINTPSVGTNNVSIGDNVAFTGSYFIHSNSPNPSVLGAGGLTIGSTTHAAGVGFRITSTSSGFFTGTGQIGILADPFFTSAATVDAYQVKAQVQTQNASFTLPIATAFYAATAAKGGSNTITRLINYLGDVQSAGTNNAWGSDNTAFTGSFVFNFTSTNPSFFTGASAQARADVASASTITALSSTNGFVKLTGSTATSLQGITAGINGQRLTIVNLTAANLTIQNENAGATAANRITTMTGADVATTANGAAEFIYDTGTSRWVCLYVTT